MNKNQRDMLATCLTMVFGHIDDAVVDGVLPLLEWIELSGGSTLLEEGATDAGVYFVISGRLRAQVRDGDRARAVAEISRGETVGTRALLTNEPSSATVVAIRDTVLAHASRESFDELMQRHPHLFIHMARDTVRRLTRPAARKRGTRPANLCLVAITDGVDVREFGDMLVAALDRWGVATLETSDRIDERFGAGAAQVTQRDADVYGKVSLWLDDVEFWNQFVVFATDDEDSEWTRRCLRQADEILFLARADAPAALHAVERRHFADANRVAARQTIVLLHDEDVPHPTGTRAWLDRRPVDAHLHVRPTLSRDVQRLARIVSGNAVGLVLAGGGARGFTHLGVYKALEEAGIAIDMVGGTSIGAAMGAWISWDRPCDTTIGYARRSFASNPTGDLRVPPLISLIKGRRLRGVIDRSVTENLGADADVADTWRTYFCIATNFSQASEMVITRGPLARAVRASLSIPVALPPLVWDGDLLFDGGMLNNFPTDVMARMGAGRIIGVDLARERTRKYEFDEVPSTWQLFLERFRGRKRRYRLPGLGAVVMGSSIIYSEARRADSRELADICLNPDIGRIGLLDWKAIDRGIAIGYEHAREELAKLTEDELAKYRDV